MSSIPTSDTAAPVEQAAIDCGYVASGPTTLRCAKCSKPLMVKDAQRTPVGYVCPNYVKKRVATFYNGLPQDYFIVAAVGLASGFISGLLFKYLGGILFWFIFLVGGAVGGVIAEILRRVLQRRRNQYTWLVAAVCVAIGALPFVLLPGLLAGRFVFQPNIYGLLGIGVAIAALIARLRI